MSAQCCGVAGWAKVTAPLESVDKAAKKTQWRALHAVADKMQPQIKRDFLRAMRSLKNDATLAKVVDAVNTGRIDTIIQIIGMDTLNARLNDLRNAVRNTYQQGAAASQPFVPKTFSTLLQFDLINPASINYLQNYEFNLVKDISQKTMLGLRSIISTAFETGITPVQQARLIRNVIGLTDRQASSVAQYERMLRETTDFTPTRIGELTGKFADRQLRWRATTIARTESIRAAGAGREALWHQMMANGTLNAADVRRYWVVTPDDRLCPICEDIPLNNEDGVGMDEAFELEDGEVMQEPAHPNCRCSVEIKYLKEDEKE